MRRKIMKNLIKLILVLFAVSCSDNKIPTKPLHQLSLEELKKIKFSVESIFPSNRVEEDVMQILVHLTKPILKSEQLKLNNLISITPEVDCQWQVFNETVASCELSRPLIKSTRFKIKVSKNITSADNQKLENDHISFLTTQKWKVIQTRSIWERANEPIVFLTFSQEMDLSSLNKLTTNNCQTESQFVKPTKKEQEVYFLNEKTSFKVTLSEPVNNNKACYLTIPSHVKALSGSEPGEESKISVSGFPALEVKYAYCSGGKYHQNDRHNITLSNCRPKGNSQLSFSNEINLSKVVIKSTDEAYSKKIIEANSSDDLFSDRLNIPSVKEAQKDIIITISNIYDLYGRSYAKPVIVKIGSGDFASRLNLPNRFNVYEVDSKQTFSIKGINVEKFFYKKEIIADDKVLIDWVESRGFKPGCETQFNTLKLQEKRNEMFFKSIDLGDVVKGKVVKFTSYKKVRNCYKYDRDFYYIKTDIGILSKVGFFDGGIWAHSISTGLPIAGTTISVYLEGKKIFEGSTDQSGFIKTPGLNIWDKDRNYIDRWKVNNLVITAKRGEQFSILPFELGHKGLEAYEFNRTNNDGSLYFNGLKEKENFLFSGIMDRWLYKPGEMSHLKIFARKWSPENYVLELTKEAIVTVYDPSYTSVHTQKIKFNEFGTSSFDFEIPLSAKLGKYIVNVSIAEVNKRVFQFQVQEFKSSFLKVTSRAEKKIYNSEDELTFMSHAKLQFGGNYVGSGDYRVEYEPLSWEPVKQEFKSYRFGRGYYDFFISDEVKSYKKTSFTIREGKFTTNKNGNFVNMIKLPKRRLAPYGRVKLTTSVEDSRGKKIGSQAYTHLVGKKSFLGIRIDQKMNSAQKMPKIEIINLSFKEKKLFGQKIEMLLIQKKYQTIRVKTSGNYYSYDSRPYDELVGKCNFVLKKDKTQCDFKGNFKEGSYYVYARLANDHENYVTDSFYLSGSSYYPWAQNNNDVIELVLDKESYTVGDTARLMIKAPFQKFDSIITFERFGILKKMIVKDMTNTQAIQLKLDDKFLAPGFYLNVHVIKGRLKPYSGKGPDLSKPSFKMGMKRIKVLNPETISKIKIKTDKKDYTPGEEVVVKIENSNLRAQEYSVAVVDDKVLSLVKGLKGRYNIRNSFYYVPDVDVQTSQLLSYLMGRRHFGQKGADAGGDGGEGSSSKVRNKRIPLAFWKSDLVSDENGHVSFKFILPDNLTTWNILVTSVDKKHSFGFNNETFQVSKNLMIEPALPNFLGEGDIVDLKYVLHNRLKGNVKINSGLSATPGLGLVSKKSLKNLKANSSGDFLSSGKVPMGIKKVKLNIDATSDSDQDAIGVSLDVRPNLSYDVIGNYGTTLGKKTSLGFSADLNTRSKLNFIDYEFSSSLLFKANDLITSMLKYPYYCWEQRLTKIVILANYLSLHDKLKINLSKKDAQTELDKLLGSMNEYQAQNGGMGYWKSDSRLVDPYLTAYTALAGTWLHSRGIKLSANFQNVDIYLRNLINGKIAYPSWYRDREKKRTEVMIVLALKQRGLKVDSHFNRLVSSLEKLDLFSLSQILQMKPEANVSKLIMKKVNNKRRETSSDIQFVEKYSFNDYRTLSSEMKTNCSLLSAFSKAKLKDSSKLARFVTSAMQSHELENTQNLVFCFNAIVDYVQAYEQKSSSFDMNFSVDDENESIKVSADQNLRGQRKQIKLDKKIYVNFEKKNDSRLYYSVRLHKALKKTPDLNINKGFSLMRSYEKKDEAGKWLKMKRPYQVRRGDTIKIILKVSAPAKRVQIVLEDSLPAGFEPINQALATNLLTEQKEQSWYDIYFSGGFYHEEMRLKGGQFFADQIRAGSYTKEYFATAIATGSFHAPPAVVKQMYQADVYGKSKPELIHVIEK